MQTNVMGTVNILEIIKEHHFIKWWVIITTDKVYENKERVYPYRETDRLGWHDPYSSSKAMAELACNSYKKSFLDSLWKKIAVVRAGNVIWWWDRCNDRLIPDIIRSCYQKESLVLRNPHAVRPWQYVLEALHGYLMIWEKLFIDDVYCTTYNFGPNQEDTMKVVDIVDKAIEILEVWSYTIDSKENRSMHEAHLLLLDTNKAKTLLWWEQKYNVSQALEKTLIRYKKYYDHEDILNTCLNEINYYI
jgi:CDP-glucose 4,6-dehydratase